MKTIEDTPFGRFEISWGVDAVREIESQFGPFDGFKSERHTLTFRDPLHGEWTILDVYRHRKNSDCIVLLGEITNGVWANGFQIDGMRQ